MLPELLAADPSNAVEMQLLQWLAMGAGSMAMALYALALRKLGSLGKANEKLAAKQAEDKQAATNERHAIEIVVVSLQGDVRELKAKVAALESNTLTKPIFDMAMGSQNKTLDTQTRMLEKHDRRLSDLVADVVRHDGEIGNRATKSEMSMLAARRQSPSPIPRSDSEPPKRRTDGTVELAPGPVVMRPKLKSQRDE